MAETDCSREYLEAQIRALREMFDAKIAHERELVSQQWVRVVRADMEAAAQLNPPEQFPANLQK